MLNKIDSPADLKELSIDELTQLCEELRGFLIEHVSKSGGHLASSLGAIELTMALHYVLNTPEDKIIWDVGHQSYPHKILTGRRDSFHTLRQYGGISGFPKPSESEYDTFGTGHSSTSISAALGMAAARDLKGEEKRVVAVIGDGSMTAGLAFEGLNQAGDLKKNLTVILNDNEMSISKNVGALSNFLSRKVTGRLATRIKREIESFLKSIPMIGDSMLSIAKRAEDSLISLLTPGMLFEGLGFHYIGPVDGHDLGALIKILKDTEDLDGPVLIHALTKKGKGYLPAEELPSKFHGVGPFDAESGEIKKSSSASYTSVFSSTLIDIAASDDKVIAITAAMPEGTGLNKFQERFPDRFFDVGIAEQHALTFAAGLAREGYKPVTAIYSTFLQRAFDELIHDICTQKLPVVIAIDRAGIVGADGPTHHGLYDISFLRHIPNLVVAAPKDEEELRHLLYSAVNYEVATAVRYPRGNVLGVEAALELHEIPVGTSEVLVEGKDLTIFAYGVMVGPAMEAALELSRDGLEVGVVNGRFVKPLDEGCILKYAAETGKILTVEENALQGGFGSAVIELLQDKNIKCAVRRLGVPDRLISHGTQEELRGEIGLDKDGIKDAARLLISGKGDEGLIAS